MSLDFLKSLDFIGKRPRLTVDKNDKFKTPLGGVTSVLVFLFTVSISIYFGREVWERTSPVVNRTLQVTESPAPLLLDKINFDLFFGLQYQHKLFIDNTIYNLTMTLNTFETGIGFIYSPIQLEACTNSSFTEETFDIFSKYSFVGAWCVSKGQSNLQLSKKYGQNGFNFLEIFIYPCKNSTSNDYSCKPKNVIDQYLNGNYFSYYTMNNYIQTTNYENPYSPAIYNNFAPVSYQSYLSSTLFIYHTQVVSDIGFLFIDQDYINSFTVESYTTQYFNSPSSNGAVFEMSIQLTNYQEIYYRTYVKLQDLMARIGGIANLFMIIGSLIVKYYTNLQYKLYLVNCCYDIPTQNPLNFSRFNDNGDLISNQTSTKKVNNYIQHAKIMNDSFNIEKNDKFNDDSNALAMNNKNINQNNFKLNAFKDSPNNVDLSKNNLVSTNDIGFPKNREKVLLSSFEKLIFCFQTKKTSTKKNLIEENYIPVKNQLSFENLLDLNKTVSIMRYFLFSRFDNNLIDYIGNPLLTLKNYESMQLNPFQQMFKYINKKMRLKLQVLMKMRVLKK